MSDTETVHLPASATDSPRDRSRAHRIKTIGGYALLRKLGQGGMGTVFKARQVSLDRIVALKVLPPSLAADSNFLRRFQREARACGKLVHPNIVQGIDVGQDPSGVWYFAMEYVDGTNLRKLLKSEGKLDEPRVLQIAVAISRALACANRFGFVHRDIKPENILISCTGEIKLADLGLAKQQDCGSTAGVSANGKVMGTPFYMSPEQAMGKNDKIDIRTDFYALGATLFHLLTGRPPFIEKSPVLLLKKHLKEPAPFAHEICPEVSVALSRLIARMMEKKRDRRPSTPEILIEQLEAIARGEDPEARQPEKGKKTTGPQTRVAARRKVFYVRSASSKSIPLAGIVCGILVAGFMLSLFMKPSPRQRKPFEVKPAAVEPEQPQSSAIPFENSNGLNLTSINTPVSGGEVEPVPVPAATQGRITGPISKNILNGPQVIIEAQKIGIEHISHRQATVTGHINEEMEIAETALAAEFNAREAVEKHLALPIRVALERLLQQGFLNKEESTALERSPLFGAIMEQQKLMDHAHLSAALNARKGQSLELMTSSGQRTGRMVEATPEGIKLAQTSYINAKPIGERISELRWEELSAAGRFMLLRELKLAQIDALAIHQGLLVIKNGEAADALDFLKLAQNHPLYDPLSEILESMHIKATNPLSVPANMEPEIVETRKREQSEKGGVNVIKNAGFEEGMAEWTSPWNNVGRRVAVGKTTVHSGKQALVMPNKISSFGQTFQAEPKKKYRVRWWATGDGLESLQVYIDAVQKFPTKVESNDKMQKKNDSNMPRWYDYALEFTAQNAQFNLIFYKSRDYGTISIDDISVEEIISGSE